MNKQLVIQKTAVFVKERLENDTSGHDWWHTYRVWKLSVFIAKAEGADEFIVQLAALLHDVADWKFNKNNLKAGSNVSRKWLSKLCLDERTIREVCYIVENISFKGARVKSDMRTKEGEVVQDADRLDSLGAIGIARTFAYGGHKGRKIYDPDIKPILHKSFEEYSNAKSSSINHFYEKLLLLKDLMNTKTGKKIAQKRHRFLKIFLREFLKEWESKY